MLKKISFFVIFFVAAQTIIFAQDNGQVNDIEQVKNKLHLWEESFNKKELKNFGSFYAEDYLGQYPNQSDQTYASTLSEYTRLFQNTFLNIKLNFEILEVQTGNNFGFMRIIETSEVKPNYSTKSQYAQDTGILIWKKQSNGEWKIFRSTLFPLVIEKEKQ